MFSPKTMSQPMHKGLRFVLGAILLMAVLVACQSHTVLQNECKAEDARNANKEACRERRGENETKQRFSHQFKVDPHAGHKAFERVAITTPATWTGKKENEGIGEEIGDATGATIEAAKGKTKGEAVEGKKRATNRREPVRTVSFSIKNPDHKFRHYAHSVISPNLHVPRFTRYEEKTGYPRLRTGSIQFDALFALALNEMRASQLSRTSDSDYQNGKSQGCVCFGDKNSAHFLALPDLAFSGYLSLSTLSDERMENSLLFHLSSYRDGLAPPKVIPGKRNGLQIIQRAGKYGSWPVYSDRILWALAADKTLYSLGDDTQAGFSKSAYHALKNTIEIDRVSIFDGANGLYIGAYSEGFSHGSSIVNTTELAATKNLIVNLSYYHALKFAADLAQSQHDIVSSVKYSDWAVDLKHAINQKFWVMAAGLYRSQYRPSFFSNTSPQFEWWVQALAVDLGVAGNREGDIVMAHHPKLDDIVSPFHAAISLRAAAKVKRVGIADIAYRRLIDNASAQMSNQKMFETVGGKPQTHSTNGNLLSVSAYGSMVIDTLFGVKISKRGLRFEPFITKALRKRQFGEQRSISLMNIHLQQKKITIKIIFPTREEQAKNKGAYYSIRAVEVNGKNVSGEVAWSRMNATNKVVITLGKLIKNREAGREGRGNGKRKGKRK